MTQAAAINVKATRPFAVLPFTVLTSALFLLTALYVGHASLRHLGLVVPNTAVERGDAVAYELVVGGINFRVPTGYLRFAEQHRNGILPAIDLVLAWPTMAPLGDAEALRVTPQDSIVFVGISDSDNVMDSTDLLGSVYREVFVGPTEHLANGLVRRRLDPQAGYVDEDVLYDISRGSGFAARCSGGGDTLWQTCFRDIILTNGLTVTYRFSPTILDQWENLDRTILEFLILLAQTSENYAGGDERP